MLKGFHLIEILIVLAVISLLTAVSIPIYSQYLVKANRLEAANMLSKLAIAMEHFHIENNTYQNATLSALQFPAVNNHYQFVIQSGDVDYQLVAKPIGYQAEKDKDCGELILNSKGEKGVGGKEQAQNCW